MAPAANTLFFAYQALAGRGGALLPADLKLLVLGVGAVALAGYARAAGLLGGGGPAAPAQKKPKRV